MAKKMSNKERIQRQAMEAEAKEKAKAEKKAGKKAGKKAEKKTPTARAPRAEKKTEKEKSTRLKVVWVIFDDRFKEVRTFPYAEKAAAEAKAAQLTEKSGKEHVVNPIKVPVDDG